VDAPVASRSLMTSSSAATDALWLDTLHRICSRAAHELKGALNGVAVNLEVVRSRAEKPDAPASAVSKFANAAVGQLDNVIAMTEALLSLTRPAPEPPLITAIVRHIEALVAPVVRADGGCLDLQGSFDELGFTSANGNAVRLAVGASMLAALDASPQVRGTVVTGEARATIRFGSDGGTTPAIDAAVLRATAEAGIRIQAESDGISISFPR
jgi:signal transduction histidine kinase